MEQGEAFREFYDRALPVVNDGRKVICVARTGQVPQLRFPPTRRSVFNEEAAPELLGDGPFRGTFVAEDANLGTVVFDVPLEIAKAEESSDDE